MLKKLPIFLCCNSSKSYLLCLLALPVLLNAAHALAKTKCKLLCDCISRLGIQQYVRILRGNRMLPIIFLRVPRTLGLQLANSGCYTGTSIATFHSMHSILPCHAHVVTSDYAISVGNVPVPPDFLRIFLALCCLLYLTYFSEIYAGRLGLGLLSDWTHTDVHHSTCVQTHLRRHHNW